jgi:hypothetical protein
MGKRRLCVKAKIYNLGLSVEVATGSQHTVAAATAATTTPPTTVVNSIPNNDPASTTDSSKPELVIAQQKRDGPLPSIEEKLRVLDAALVALEKPGVKVYQEAFGHFVNYRALETELVELRKQLASEKNQR